MEGLRDLHLFVCVAKCSSFTAAAKKFSMSPASVSQIIAKLEREMDTRLFHRSTRQVHLTEEGKLFLATSTEGLGKLDEAVELVKEMRHEPRGLVRLTTSYSSFDEETLMPLLGEFLRKYPKVDLEINFEDRPVDIIKEGYDISIRPFPSTSNTCISKRISQFPLLLVASTDYLQRMGIPKSVEDLKSHEWVNFHPPWRARATVEFEPVAKSKKNPKGAAKEMEQRTRLLITGHGYVAASSAMAGIGIALLSSRVVLPYLRTGKLKVLLPGVRRKGAAEIYVEYPHRRFVAQKVRVLLDYLFDQLPRRSDASISSAKELRSYTAI